MEKSKSNKKYGFVIPVYKIKEEYLRQCVNSILQQSREDIEVILVEDCSPDNCGELCEKLAGEDCRISVIHHELNKGVSEARNDGVDACEAKWLVFVDGDDWLSCDFCKSLDVYFSNTDCEPDIVCFSGTLAYIDCECQDIIENKICVWRGKEIENLQIEAMTIPLKKTPPRMLSLESVCGKVYRTDFLKYSGVRMRKIPHREDGLFIQELLQKAQLVTSIPDHLYYYRQTANSAVNSFRKYSPEEQKEYLSLLFEFAKSNNINDNEYTQALYCAAFLSAQIVITSHYFNNGNRQCLYTRYRDCRKYFSQAPYCDIFENVKLKELTRNHLIKALCIKLKFYPGVSLLRNIYKNMNRYKLYE